MALRVSLLPRIHAETELLILPYASTHGASVLERLVNELQSRKWTAFRCAIAFGKQSGNIPTLISALDQFLASGGEVSITFGADTFSGRTKGTDLEAVGELLGGLEKHQRFELHLYHEGGRTFHPKVYFFDSSKLNCGLLIIGSSNWSEGGLFNNLEANVVLHLDYTKADHTKLRDAMTELFTDYWGEG